MISDPDLAVLLAVFVLWRAGWGATEALERGRTSCIQRAADLRKPWSLN